MTKFEKVIEIINRMTYEDKLRLGISLSTSTMLSLSCDKMAIYQKMDRELRRVDEEYRTTIINFSKYFNVNFTTAQVMELDKNEQDEVVLYLLSFLKTVNNYNMNLLRECFWAKNLDFTKVIPIEKHI